MKKLIFIFIISFASISFGEYFEIDLKEFPRLEVKPDGRILLQRPWNDLSNKKLQDIQESGNTWTCNAVMITPPTGVENQYLSLVLTAYTTDKKIYAQGSGTGKGDLQTTKILME